MMLKLFKRNGLKFLALSVASVLALEIAIPAPAEAQRARRNQENVETDRQTVRSEVGSFIVAAQELEQAGQTRQGINTINQALAIPDLTPYEYLTIYSIRAGWYYDLGDVNAAIQDFQNVIRFGQPSESVRLNLRFNIGQLLMSEERFLEAAQAYEEWMQGARNSVDPEVKKPDHTHYLNLAIAYSQVATERTGSDARNYFGRARGPAETAKRMAPVKERKYFDLLNYIYTELNLPRERAALLQEMLGLFPTDVGIWKSIAALYAQGGEEGKAFEINKMMYLAGFLETEQELLRLAEYYSYLNVPFEGARILEKEMNAGNVERSQTNLVKLSNMWRQAREFERAIGPLSEAARRSGDCKLYEQLGQAYYSEERFDEAEDALMQVVNSSGNCSKGRAWLLIANGRYEADNRNSAREAFQQAANYPDTRRQGSQWLGFIQSEIQREEEQRIFRANVEFEEKRIRCERRENQLILFGSAEDDPGLAGVDCAAIKEEAQRRDAADAS